MKFEFKNYGHGSYHYFYNGEFLYNGPLYLSNDTAPYYKEVEVYDLDTSYRMMTFRTTDDLCMLKSKKRGELVLFTTKEEAINYKKKNIPNMDKLLNDIMNYKEESVVEPIANKYTKSDIIIGKYLITNTFGVYEIKEINNIPGVSTYALSLNIDYKTYKDILDILNEDCCKQYKINSIQDIFQTVYKAI